MNFQKQNRNRQEVVTTVNQPLFHSLAPSLTHSLHHSSTHHPLCAHSAARTIQCGQGPTSLSIMAICSRLCCAWKMTCPVKSSATMRPTLHRSDGKDHPRPVWDRGDDVVSSELNVWTCTAQRVVEVECGVECAGDASG